MMFVILGDRVFNFVNDVIILGWIFVDVEKVEVKVVVIIWNVEKDFFLICFCFIFFFNVFFKYWIYLNIFWLLMVYLILNLLLFNLLIVLMLKVGIVLIENIWFLGFLWIVE